MSLRARLSQCQGAGEPCAGVSNAMNDQPKQWTVKRASKDHAYVYDQEGKWIASASVELAQKIAEDHNRELAVTPDQTV